jgi:hypothetical protein
VIVLESITKNSDVRISSISRYRVWSSGGSRQVMFSSVGYDSSQPVPALAPAGNPPKLEVTPAPVADTDVAVTDPLLAFVP